MNTPPTTHRTTKTGFSEPSFAQVWQQDGAKLLGLDAKLKSFTILKDLLSKMQELELPSDGSALELSRYRRASPDSVQRFETGLEDFIESTVAVNNTLAMTFSGIETKKSHRASSSGGGAGGDARGRSPSAKGSRFGALVKSLHGFGQLVKNTANTAIERVGNLVPVRVDSRTLERYGLLVAEIAERVQMLDAWILYCNGAGAGGGGGVGGGAGGALPGSLAGSQYGQQVGAEAEPKKRFVSSRRASASSRFGRKNTATKKEKQVPMEPPSDGSERHTAFEQGAQVQRRLLVHLQEVRIG